MRLRRLLKVLLRVKSRVDLDEAGVNAVVNGCIWHSKSDGLRVSKPGSGLGSGNAINNSIRQIRSDKLPDANGDCALVIVDDIVHCVEEGIGSFERKQGRPKGSKNRCSGSNGTFGSKGRGLVWVEALRF